MKSAGPVLATMLLVLALTPSIVSGRAEKVELFKTTDELASCELITSAGYAGFVVFNNPKGDHDIMVQISVQNAEPGTYTVNLGYVTDDPSAGKCGGSWKLLGEIQVRSDGKGTFHFNGDPKTGFDSTDDFIIALNEDRETIYATEFANLNLG